MRYLSLFLGLIVCSNASAGIFDGGARKEILRENNLMLHSINDNANYERGYKDRDRDALFADRQRSERDVDRKPIIIQVTAPQAPYASIQTPYTIPQNQGQVYSVPQNRGQVYQVPQNQGPVYRIPQNTGPVFRSPLNSGPVYTVPPIGSGSFDVPPVDGSVPPAREPAGGGGGSLNIPPSSPNPPSGGLTVPPSGGFAAPPIDANSASYYVIIR